MGLQADEAKDHWHYDSSNASWTRLIVVPRADFFRLVPAGKMRNEAASSGTQRVVIGKPIAKAALAQRWRHASQATPTCHSQKFKPSDIHHAIVAVGSRADVDLLEQGTFKVRDLGQGRLLLDLETYQ